jgi:hypothetical protein
MFAQVRHQEPVQQRQFAVARQFAQQHVPFLGDKAKPCGTRMNLGGQRLVFKRFEINIERRQIRSGQLCAPLLVLRDK